jgi:hypothetical protein
MNDRLGIEDPSSIGRALIAVAASGRAEALRRAMAVRGELPAAGRLGAEVLGLAVGGRLLAIGGGYSGRGGDGQ